MVEIAEKNDGRKNMFRGRIVNHIFEGSYVRYWVESLGEIFVADQYNPGYRQILEGDVFLFLNPSKLHVLQ